jgi:hypothetical protein
MIRCKATKLTTLGLRQCEAAEGHKCAHYARGIWWPNKHGFPDHRFGNRVSWARWLAAAGLLCGSLLWLLRR